MADDKSGGTQVHGEGKGDFELGTPAIVCRWRLSGGSLPLENRHLRALLARTGNGKRVTKQLVAWAKQHIEWTLAEGSIGQADGVLMVVIDCDGKAAMTVGDYQPLTERHLSQLCQRALPLLRTSDCPTIINIGSVVAHSGYGLQAAYAAIPKERR